MMKARLKVDVWAINDEIQPDELYTKQEIQNAIYKVADKGTPLVWMEDEDGWQTEDEVDYLFFPNGSDFVELYG